MQGLRLDKPGRSTSHSSPASPMRTGWGPRVEPENVPGMVCEFLQYGCATSGDNLRVECSSAQVAVLVCRNSAADEHTMHPKSLQCGDGNHNTACPLTMQDVTPLLNPAAASGARARGGVEEIICCACIPKDAGVHRGGGLEERVAYRGRSRYNQHRHNRRPGVCTLHSGPRCLLRCLGRRQNGALSTAAISTAAG
jgi:hypothetical protein